MVDTSAPAAFGGADLLALQPLVEGVDPPEVGLLPVVRRVVVALGALDLLAEEDAGRDRGQVDRAVGHVGQREVDGAVLLVRPLGGQDLVGHLVPGAVLGELAAEPGGQGVGVDLPLPGIFRPRRITFHWVAKFLA